MIKVMLRIEGFDDEDLSIYGRMSERLLELGWGRLNGLSYATVHAHTNEPSRAISEAVDIAKLIAVELPEIKVLRAHERLVSPTDIAAQCQLSDEAVRMWISGSRRENRRPFPAAYEVVGGGRKVYAWREVIEWVRSVVGLDPEPNVRYLDPADLATLNHYILRPGHAGSVGPMRSQVWTVSPKVAASARFRQATERAVAIHPRNQAVVQRHFRHLYSVDPVAS